MSAKVIARSRDLDVCMRSTRSFAALYDLSFAIAQRRGLEALRREVIQQARGMVVEIGAGTGLNAPHYTGQAERVLLSEPDPNMVNKLRARATAGTRVLEVVEAPAESLPVASGSVDTVVSTLVLCTVPDPSAALREVARILRPGGRLLFLEHVRSENRVLGSVQDLFERPWFWFACGCHCNRDSLSAIKSSSLKVESVRTDRLRGLTPLIRPLIVGTAMRPEKPEC